MFSCSTAPGGFCTVAPACTKSVYPFGTGICTAGGGAGFQKTKNNPITKTARTEMTISRMVLRLFSTHERVGRPDRDVNSKQTAIPFARARELIHLVLVDYHKQLGAMLAGTAPVLALAP